MEHEKNLKHLEENQNLENEITEIENVVEECNESQNLQEQIEDELGELGIGDDTIPTDGEEFGDIASLLGDMSLQEFESLVNDLTSNLDGRAEFRRSEKTLSTKLVKKVLEKNGMKLSNSQIRLLVNNINKLENEGKKKKLTDKEKLIRKKKIKQQKMSRRKNRKK